MEPPPGLVIVLNGAPRAGKSSIAASIQETFEGPWMDLGADTFILAVTPPRYRPGVGLRPGGERPDLEPLVPAFFAAMYESIAAHSRLGLNVVADVAHHEAHASPTGILADCARRLRGLPAYLIGVRCPIEVIMERRYAGQPGREGVYVVGTVDDPVPEPVRRWQLDVHIPGVYDFEVDSSLLSPLECAQAIRLHLESGSAPTAFRTLAQRAQTSQPERL